MDFALFDLRNYPTVDVRAGYAEWADTYEETVFDEMDLRLLARIRSVAWHAVRRAADLACGTGRIGVWLRDQGVATIDGVDATPEMLAAARAKGVYGELATGDMLRTPLAAGAYDLVTEVLADEHLPALAPLYAEAARLAAPGGQFVIAGFHPFFLMSGIPTHFHRATGEAVTIRSYVHLFEEHVAAAHTAGWTLAEMHEGVVDDDWLARKPKWAAYANRPVSYAFVCRAQP